MTIPVGYRGALLVLVGTAFYSFGGVGVKLCHFDTWQLSMLRSMIAAAAIFTLVPEARRAWTPSVLVVGLCQGATMMLFVWGNKTTTAANAILLQSLAPLWIILLSPFVLKERLGWHDAVSGLAFLAGLVVIAIGPTPATELSPQISKGNWISLACGVSYALMVVGLRAKAGRGAEASLVCGNVLAAALSAVVLFGAGTSPGWVSGTPMDWLVVAGLGLVQLTGGSVFYTRGLRYVTAVRASLIGLLEPVLNPIWVMLICPNERPGGWALIGGAVILAATGYQVIVRPSEKTAES